MNKYKVIFTDAAQRAGKQKYQFIEGTSEDHALITAGIFRAEIVGIYLLDTEKVAPVESTPSAPIVIDLIETPIAAPVQTPEETFQGNGGEFGGGGSSGSFDDSPAVPEPSSSDNSPSYSDNSSSYDSGSSMDSGSSDSGSSFDSGSSSFGD